MTPSAPAVRPSARQGQVLYDGQCPLCRKSVGVLKRLDWLGLLTYVDVRDREHLPASDGPLDPERLLEEMHVLTPDGRRLYHGFAALRWMAWRLPLLWPLAPCCTSPACRGWDSAFTCGSRATASALCRVTAASARCRRSADPCNFPLGP